MVPAAPRLMLRRISPLCHLGALSTTTKGLVSSRPTHHSFKNNSIDLSHSIFSASRMSPHANGTTTARPFSTEAPHATPAAGESHAQANAQAAEIIDHTLKQTAWSQPGPAAFDFRSDVFTTPTASMLSAIVHTTLQDDVFLEDPTTNGLEAWLAELTGKQAALLVLSGTMGNQLAIRSHLAGPPHAIVCDQRSHILVYEAGGAASLSGAQIMGVPPSNGRHLTLEDVQSATELSDDVHATPTRLISLENTLNGTLMPVEEAERISAWARSHGIAIHLDGARIWEAVTAQAQAQHGKTDREALAALLRRYSAAFDTISLCFSKGLGAPIGSMLVGPASFIKKARHLRKSIGGGLRQSGVVAAPARVAVEETFFGGKLAATHRRAKEVAAMWQALGGTLAEPVETNMVWLGARGQVAGFDKAGFVKVCEEEGIKTSGGRLVVHYQICDEAIARLKRVMERVLGAAGGEVKKGEVAAAA